MNWGVTNNQQYVLCSEGIESSEHLFFTCDYSKNIWTQLLYWQGITRDQLALDKMSLSGPTEMHKETEQHTTIFRMSIAAAVNYIWTERNNQVFQAKSSKPHMVTKRIVQERCSKHKLTNKLVGLDHYA